MVKNLPADAGDAGSVPELGRSLREGNSHPLRYSCLEDPMDRGTWRATVHGLTQHRTRLEQLNKNNQLNQQPSAAFLSFS